MFKVKVNNNNISINFLYKYILNLTVKFHKCISLIGLVLFLLIIFQCLSGIMVAFSLVSDSMYVGFSRNTEDMGDLYTDDFFWLHERGVDYIFIFLIVHLFRKIYIQAYSKEQELAWKSGIFLFFLFHVVTFLGLVLCCTHLSNITLNIATGIIQTLCAQKSQIYWWFFTDKNLNTDTLIRIMYMHYVLAFFMLYIALLHTIDMHYDHKNNTITDNIEQNVNLITTCFKNELKTFIYLLIFFKYLGDYLFEIAEPLSYELFMWGDVGLINDIRFNTVSPHWYFRPYMAWLILCPDELFGVIGLLYLILSLYFQPNLKADNNFIFKNFLFFKINTYLKSNNEFSSFYKIVFLIFFLSAMYTGSCLPYGKFYQKIQGNIILAISFAIIAIFLTIKIY